MRVVAFDTETCLIRPAQLAPPLVCVTWQEPGETPGIEHHSTVEPRLRAWLEDPGVLLVGHNVAFDLAVLAERFPALRDLIFAAYDANRVTDTMIRQWLLDTAKGIYRGAVSAKGKRIVRTYDLARTAKDCAGIELQKDEWRLMYGSFIDTPLTGWRARALELQADALPRLAELEARTPAVPKEKLKAHAKAIADLRSMIESPPEQCLAYPLMDAVATFAVYQAQEVHAEYLADQYRQSFAYFVLYLSSAWGMRTDPERVHALEAAIEAELAEVDDDLKDLGLVREDGTRDTKIAKALMISVCAEERLTLIRTDTHFKDDAKCTAADGSSLPPGDDACIEHVCLDADACDRTGHPTLVDYAQRTTLGKQVSNDIPAMLGGVLYPIHTRYGFASTGRTTSSRPNIQNQSKREGFREVYIPRPGHVFIQADFPSLEAYAHAQCCVSWLGKSKLADALNAGLDPHLWVAAIILQKSYEWCEENKHLPEVKKARQLAKPANFGFPGGMGPSKFVVATRKTVTKEKDGRAKWAALGLDEARAKRLKEEWLTAWPEMELYFQRANELCTNESGRAFVQTLFTKRWRGQATYCAACNNGFQALGSDCAKRALCLIGKAQYVDRLSPLFNTRLVAFVHDEFIVEAPDNARAHDAAYALARLMVEGANALLPDVPIPLAKVDPLLMRRWSKNAESCFDAQGRLVPWAA